MTVDPHADTQPPGAPTLAPGIYVQCYLAKVPGATHAARLAILDDRLAEFAALGCRGIAWHATSTTLNATSLHDLTALCRKHRLVSLAAFGMDSSDPAGKGRRIGEVLVSSDCDGVVLDAEGLWEDKTDGDDLAHARAFRDAFLPYRRRAPGKVVVDQPWPVPLRVQGQGGHGAFPWETFAECVDARAPQWYVNDWIRMWGPRRYARCVALFAASWAMLTARLAQTQHTRPVWGTWQGYGWSDIPGDLVHVFERSLAEPTLVWSEPFPDGAFMGVWRSWHGQRCVEGGVV